MKQSEFIVYGENFYIVNLNMWTATPKLIECYFVYIYFRPPEYTYHQQFEMHENCFLILKPTTYCIELPHVIHIMNGKGVTMCANKVEQNLWNLKWNLQFNGIGFITFISFYFYEYTDINELEDRNFSN